MFVERKFKAITAVTVLMAMLVQPFSGLAATVPADVSAPEPVAVKISPVKVFSDTSALPPKLADEENRAVWRLFDRDTGTAYTPAQTARVTVSLADATSIAKLRFFGASSYQLNVYRDNNGSWESVPSLSNIALATGKPAAWNTLNADAPFTAANLLLEFIPQGNVSSGMAEVELWGTDSAAGDAATLTLADIRTPEQLGNLIGKAPHITAYAGTPSEITVPETAAAGAAVVNITLSQNPSLFKRAYLLYEGSNIAEAVSVERSINNLSWSGGFAVKAPEGAPSTWKPLMEEIDPAWLIQGENSIRFRSPNGQAYIRNLKLVVETDSGWNSVASVSAPELYDGDTATAYEVHAAAENPAIRVDFERNVEPEKIRLHLPGSCTLKGEIQYLSGGNWQPVKAGWQLDLSAMQAGWNEVSLPAPVTTSALRLVFNTSSLRLKSGVPTGAIDEILVAAAPVGTHDTPRLVVSYPRNGQFFGRTAYLQGFATPGMAGDGFAQVRVENKLSQNRDGAFSTALSKDDTAFTAQADDEAWSATVTSEYGGVAGASQTIALTSNANAGTAEAKTDRRSDSAFADNREKHSEKVAPGQAKKIKYKDVILDIPEGAVDQETEITIVPLNEADLARLDPGMINVTYPAAGYRFLPHGMKFKKPIKISFGYSKNLFAAGQTDTDVTMFFYNEKLLRWEPLTRSSVDPASSVVVSDSDHFTDIINSTLVVPEHPQALSFNPNSIKDLKAADPTANVNLIEPPKANNRGTANLSYPLEVPPGRNKIQPSLALQYNSGGGNGWMGIGWDLPVQSISIDTRWGVPRYEGAEETETYTLDGEQLTPLAHRGALQPRTAEKVFHTRVEGQFRRIVRHGTAPNNYWWEVTDKNGTSYFYGRVPNAPSDAVLADPAKGNIFKWALRQVRDTNGNTMNYNYALVADTGLVHGGNPGQQLYLKAIDYTGHGDKPGAYTVVFTRDRELPNFDRRKDVTIDARSGFKMVTADRLRTMEVYFGGGYSNGAVLGGTLVRRYEFKYNEDAYGDHRQGTAFNKTLLTSVAQYGKDGGLFNTHKLTYYDEARNGNGTYHGFAASQDWGVGSDGVKVGLLGYGNASALGGTEGNSIGGHLYLGVGTPGSLCSKVNTGGAKIGYNESSSESVLTMADMDGDGLPDKVFKGDDGFYYRKNLSGPHGSNIFGDRVPLAGLTAISKERTTSLTFGVEEYFFGTSSLIDTNKATTKADTYFADVNGDGLLDLVSGGHVLFGYLNAKKEPVFDANSTLTPVPIGSGTIDTVGLLEDPATEEAERAANFPLLDTVRRWVAPYDGTVSIDAPVNLIQASSEERAQHQGADGVQVAIQLEGNELWSTRTAQIADPRNPNSARLLADDFTSHTPTGVGSVQVKRGDRLYFRVQSVFDGSLDRVSWNPQITYLNSDTSRTDVNALPAYVYHASREFTLAGRQSSVTMPLTGTVHFAGTLAKSPTTDDVTLVILRNGSEVYRLDLPAAESSSVNIAQDLSVTQADELQVKVLVDSPIDASLVAFAPTAYYTAANGLDSVKNEKGEYMIRVSLPYSMDLYPDDGLTAPQDFWKAPQSGNIIVVPALALSDAVSFANGASTAQVVFTVKKRGVLLGKGTITIGKNTDGTLTKTPLTLSVPVSKDDELFFDFSSRDTTISKYVTAATVQVSTDATSFETVPSAFHGAEAEGAFPVPFRGWGTIGYNGNAPRDGQAIDQSLLIIDDSFNPKKNPVMVYPYVPVPASGAWGGLDDGAWLKASEVSSSRLGLDDIRLPRSEDFAGAAAPARISKSTNLSISGGYGGVSAGYSRGSSESRLDFMDLNGDRFPDVVSQGGVQFTGPNGALNGNRNGDVSLGNPRSNKNETYQGSLNPGSIASAIANAKGNVAPNGGGGSASGAQGSEMPSFNMDGSYGTSEAEYDLIDINGDGLPDKVYKDGTASLNLGYNFSAPEPWGGGIVNDGQTVNGGVGLSLGYNQEYYSIAGGLGLSLGLTRSDETYVDINGDGLPDKVSFTGNVMTVRLNQGGSFSDPIYWPGGQGKIAEDAHVNLSGGVYFTIGFQIWAIRVVINPGISFANSMGRPEYAFRDMDGDGFVDHVYSDKDSKLSVATNPIGRTNLLKTVTRPLGGTFDLEYTREGNTYEMPQSQWLLTNVTLSDGMGRSYKTGYTYADPHQDRFEREFYGFAQVQENQAPGTAIARTVAETFNNRDYYLKGLLEKTVTSDWRGNVWAQKANTYVLADVGEGSKFPQLQRTDTYFYDGATSESGHKKSTYQTFTYDSYGDVTAFYDAGELSTGADDVTATISYWSDPQQYIRKPDTITVRDAGSNVLRKRWASYENTTGNLKSHTSLVRGNQNATWQMTYDTYGNIRTIGDPVSYSLTYDYDSDTNTYVTRISDNFSGRDGGPYWSTAGYDLKWGKPAWSRDLNGNYELNYYDEFGRLASVYGPYDTDASGRAMGQATLAFEYKAPVIALDGENLTTPAGAITRNKAVSRVGSNGNTLDTVIYADGMKRVLQTKKEADVEGRYGMVASGLITYDELGRTIEQGQPIFQSAGDLYGYLPLATAKNPTKTAYDTLDRTIRLETPDSQAAGGYAQTTTTYGFGQVNNSGNLYATTKVVDPIGNAAWEANRKGTKLSYKDVDDRIMAVVEYNHGAPITTTYDYDPLGQITLVKDDRGNRTTVEYDLVGKRTAIVNPDTGRTEYGYDANGNLTSKLTANYQKGKEIRYDYIFNRLMRINYPDSPSVTYQYGPMNAAYNRAGRITMVTDESGTEERYYGNLGETIREVKQVNAHTPAASRKIYTTDYVFDSFGRMLQMTYPDGENLYYSYDNGGLLNAAWGEKRGNRYNYINSLTYDEFGQRKFIAYGNNVKSSYSYDDKTRRLESLITTTPDTRTVQNMSYGYDLVGNVLKIQNSINVPTNTALPAGPVMQEFSYDDLYQLTNAQGEYQFGSGKGNRYTNEFTYDTIGNFTRKYQQHKIIQPSQAEHLPKETNYLLNYKYTGPHPHAVTDAGDKLYSYDNNGNMTGWDDKTSGKRRTILWNEENRVKEIQDNGKSTYFLYDDAGERVLKRGQHGETFYINRFYSIRNGELGTKSIYAGNTRVVSKLVKTPNTTTANTQTATNSTTPGINGLDNGQGKKLGIIRRLNGSSTTAILPPEEKDQFFYHGDHLGSSNMITDSKGAIYQHLEYFPYGETWIEEGGSYGGNTPGYKFTGKELDPETGLYYFGARYYEPVISRWISADPILDRYLPETTSLPHDLPGFGGIYNPINMSFYDYGAQNPVKFVDPDGNVIIVPIIIGAVKVTGWAITAYSAYQTAKAVSSGEKTIGAAIKDEAVGIGIGLVTLGAGKIVEKGYRLYKIKKVKDRVAKIHGVLDPIAKKQRTTAGVTTKEGKRVFGGGKRDLTPAQRKSLQDGEIAAKNPSEHAEITALERTKAEGLSPQNLEVSRDICPDCASRIQEMGGKITGPKSASFD
jgi:RHS repeat-associated protein